MSHACSMYNNHHIQFSPISVPDSHIQHMSLLTCSSCQWMDYFCQWMVILCSSCQRLWIQGFPWCCSTCKLLSLFRLYRMCPVYWSSFPSRMCPVYWSPFAMYSVERFVLHGLRMPSIQSNDLSYKEQIPTSCILRADYADLL